MATASTERESRRGQAALSLNSAFAQKRYQDEGTDDGVLYRYQDGPVDNHFNRWLRSAHTLDVPLVYFIGTRPNWYRPEYPVFVEADHPAERSVLVSFGEMRGPYDERLALHLRDPIERRYKVREVKQRLHQAQFRGQSCWHTATVAPSAASGKCGSLMPPTSSATLTNKESHWSATGSAFARSTTALSTKTSSV